MLVRPISARECLIHHRDLWSRVVVEFREQAATEQRQPEQVKVLGRNSGPLDKSRLLLIDVLPFKRQLDGSLKNIQFVLGRIQRNRRWIPECGCFYTGKSRSTASQLTHY